jgi:hypothetical protein
MDRPRPTIDLSYKTGGRLHYAGRSHGHENSAGVQCVVNSIRLERNLAEPADVRTNPTAAFAPGEFGWRLVEVCGVKWRAVASVATQN